MEHSRNMEVALARSIHAFVVRLWPAVLFLAIAASAAPAEEEDLVQSPKPVPPTAEKTKDPAEVVKNPPAKEPLKDPGKAPVAVPQEKPKPALIGPKKGKREPYTILQVAHYDGSASVEVVKQGQALYRIQEIMSDYRVWQEADRLARTQWSDWFRSAPNEERTNRRWVLPNPAPPKCATAGKFADEFDSDDKVKQLREEIRKNAENRKKFSDLQTLYFLDNLEENQKALRAKLPEARENLLKKDEIAVKRIDIGKKRAIWDLVYMAEVEARRKVEAKTPKDEEPDILEIYNTQQDFLKPIYEKYAIDEGQWAVIWEEGYNKKWPIPAKPAK